MNPMACGVAAFAAVERGSLLDFVCERFAV